MNTQYEAIYQKALQSNNCEVIVRVAQCFATIGETDKASILNARARLLRLYDRKRVGFGAMARGTPIASTNGAVIPPGRYWIDLSKAQEKAFTDWSQGKPEVHVESTEDNGERLFIILTIPTTANNYGLPGVFYPTQVLGFPTIAAANVTSSADTISRPDPFTYTEAAKEIAESVGEVLGAGTKGASKGLGISTTTIVLFSVGALVALMLVNRIMMPIPRI
jgi:hypothetical protein